MSAKPPPEDIQDWSGSQNHGTPNGLDPSADWVLVVKVYDGINLQTWVNGRPQVWSEK